MLTSSPCTFNWNLHEHACLRGHKGGRNSVAIKRPCREDKVVGSNPADTENRTEGGSIVLTGREWKSSKMIAEPRLFKNRKKKP